MTMKKIVSYIAGAMMLLIPVASGAQALPFTAADFDAASLGTAGANLTGVSSIAHSAFVNAAAIPFADDKMDVAAGYTMWKPTSGNVINVAGAYNMNNKFGVAVGFIYGMNPAYDVTNASGTSKKTFSPSDMQVNAGLSYRFLPFLSVGANVGYATQSLAPEVSYGSVTADVFAMAEFSDLRVAAGVANLGGGIEAADGTKFSLPASAALGVGYGKVFAKKHGVDAMVDLDYFFQGGVSASLGAAYVFDDMVTVRAGYRYGGKTVIPSYASVGAGVKFMGIKLDLSYLIASGPIANTLAVSLGYSF